MGTAAADDDDDEKEEGQYPNNRDPTRTSCNIVFTVCGIKYLHSSTGIEMMTYVKRKL